MEDIFEFLATAVLEIISGSKYKYATTRTWAITVFYLIVGGGMVGCVAWACWTLPEDFAVLFRVFAVLLVAGFVFYVIRGHRKNWPRTWM